MERLRIEIVYALRDQQYVLTTYVPAGATVGQAIDTSGICAQHPEIDLARQAIGVYGRRVSLDRPLRHDDRVEIYRTLIADPKIVRRGRAAKRAR